MRRPSLPATPSVGYYARGMAQQFTPLSLFHAHGAERCGRVAKSSQLRAPVAAQFDRGTTIARRELALTGGPLAPAGPVAARTRASGKPVRSRSTQQPER